MNDIVILIIVILIIGYIGGCVSSWIIFRPMKSFREGYDSAKALYSNWEKGFDQGFDRGFDEGVKAAMKAEDGDTQ